MIVAELLVFAVGGWQIERGKPISVEIGKEMTYVQGKLLPTELRGWFLIAVLARDGPDHKSRSPHRRMNLYTIISLLKNSVKVSDQVYREFRQAVKECLEIAGERYHIFLMCSALPLLTFISAGFKRMVSSTLSPTA